MENNNHIGLIEALILASPEPLAVKRITESGTDLTPSGVAHAVMELNARYESLGSSFRIREVAGGYQYYILPEYSKYVEALFTRHRRMRLTRAALETLAIVAYKQPVTKVDIDHIRGVESDGVVHNLLEKNLVVIKGRAESVGRPLQYATTDEFLKFFGLNTLEELPEMSEIEELIKASEGDKSGGIDFEDGDTVAADTSTNGNESLTLTLVKEEEEPED